MKNEEQLSAQLQGLRDQFSLRKSSLQDHVGHLEIMREEVWLFNEFTILLLQCSTLSKYWPTVLSWSRHL